MKQQSLGSEKNTVYKVLQALLLYILLQTRSHSVSHLMYFFCGGSGCIFLVQGGIFGDASASHWVGIGISNTLPALPQPKES